MNGNLFFNVMGHKTEVRLHIVPPSSFGLHPSRKWFKFRQALPSFTLYSLTLLKWLRECSKELSTLIPVADFRHHTTRQTIHHVHHWLYLWLSRSYFWRCLCICKYFYEFRFWITFIADIICGYLTCLVFNNSCPNL